MLLHSKKDHKQDEKTTLRMGENICKWSNWQKINLQNIQIAHVAQHQKNKVSQKNWVENLNRHFSKDDIQMANKHMKRCSTSLTIVVVQLPSHVQLFVTPRTAAHQASLSLTISWSLPKFMSIFISDAIQSSHPLMPPFPSPLH